MFAELYFDAQNHLRKVAVHEPFDKLLELAKNEPAKTLLETAFRFILPTDFVICHLFRFSDELRKG
jgi:hypothetical protein